MRDDIHSRSVPNRDRLIHILDADHATCQALSVVLRLEGYQTSFALDSVGFFAAFDRRRPDVVILNLRPGGDDRLAILRRIKAVRPVTAVFVLEDHPRVDDAVAAMKCGASDVLTKPIDMDHLVRAVRDALRQAPPVGSLHGRRPVAARDLSQLTPRERQVLQLIAKGHSNKETGRELGISPRTVEVYRARVMEKLGAGNAADLMWILLLS